MGRRLATTALDTRAFEDGAGLDFGRLRQARLDRCVDAMDRHGLDALVLGRDGNARYASGARRLWRAVVTPHVPTCVVVAASRQVHLMNTWDDGIPAEIPTSNLFGLSWNPENIRAHLAAIEGLDTARRIGVDGLSTFSHDLLTSIAPAAELVDGEAVMREARAVKLADEVVCIERALAIAEGCLDHALAGLRPGVSEQQLLARFRRRMGELDNSIAATAGSVSVTGPGDAAAQVRAVPTSRPARDGDLVVLDGGVLYAGYEGSLARTRPCLDPEVAPTAAQRDLFTRWRQGRDAVLARLRPGSTTHDVLAAFRGSGAGDRAALLVNGVGMGAERPWISADAADVDVEKVAEGMVLGLQVHVWDRAVGSVLARDVVHVHEDGAALLTTAAHRPLDDA